MVVSTYDTFEKGCDMMPQGKNTRRESISYSSDVYYTGSELESLAGTAALDAQRAAGMAKRRLWALPGLLARAEELKDEIDDLNSAGALGTPEHSMSVALAVRPGMRITREEAWEKQLELLERRAQSTKREIGRVKRALAYIESDEYYRIIPEHYMRQKTFEELAEMLNCSVATVYRNHKRLLSILAARMYGA